MSEKHLFPGKMVDVIIACKVVTINFSEHITVLTPVRTNWTPAYATEITTRVDTITETYMGVKARDALFQATITLNKLVGPAKDDRDTVKNSITSTLGVTGHSVRAIRLPCEPWVHRYPNWKFRHSAQHKTIFCGRGQ